MSGKRRLGPKTVPLSFAQERLWFIDRFEPDSALYNIPLVLRLRGRLDPGALTRALGEIVRRHEMLRTRFSTLKDVPVQVIRPELGQPLPVVDLTGLPAGARRAAADRLALAEARHPFDLASGPLLRTTLLWLEAGSPERTEHALLFTVHHIAFDGWSVGVFLHELTALYQAFSAGAPSPLPELPIQYADYAVWQRQRLFKRTPGEEWEKQLAHWREQLAGLGVLELPSDRPRPAVQSFRGALHCFQLPAHLHHRLVELSRRQRSTLFVTLMAAFQALLGRYTGQLDLAVGTAIANRQPAEVQGLLGLFVNTLVLRGDLSGSPTFCQLLRRLHRVALKAYAHQDLPFEKLVEELKPERDLSYNPLVQAFLTLQYASAKARELAPGLGLGLEYPSTGQAKFDLSLSLEEDDGELRCELIYSTDLYDATTIRRLVGHLRRLLAAVADDAELRLSELPLLSRAEGQQLRVEWNDTRRRGGGDDPGREPPTLHYLFERQVARTPEAVAAVGAGRYLSYRQLNRRANRLAHTLRALGVEPETLVGICSERSTEMVTGILGILKSGGAYLPLDPDTPSPRLAFMLEDAGARVLLTQKRLLELLPEHRARVLCLDADQEEVALHSPVNPRPAATAANLAYLIYTSGSTGRAKGVAIEHRRAVGLVEWAREFFAPEEVAGVLGATSLCFDLSVFELFAPLTRGGRVIVAENALELRTLAAAAAVTLVNTVPSAMRELVRLAELPPSVRTVNLAGETLPRELVDEVYRHPGVERVFNLYGPSEDTTYSTWARLERGRGGPPAIGRPVADTRAWLLDRRQRPVPVGVPGELALGGAGLARGYLDRPALTAERFVPDPFGETLGARLYRTGDLARALPNGELAFLGRLDHQVKVRGFRIELGEIETVLVRHPGVREAVVVVREDPGPARLVAYAVAEGEDVTPAELREFLHRTLPEYMVPSRFVILEAMPLGPTGKVDRRALPAPEAGGGRENDAAPRTPTEEMMADLWSRILGTRQIGIRDHFFELGGHSLLATRLLSRLRELFGVELDLRCVFQHPTLAGLAAQTDRARRAGRVAAAPPIRPAARRRERFREGVPLSFAQKRLWFLAQLTPDQAIYNIPLALGLCGALDPAALAGGLREIVRRHEVLRTRFETVAGKPVQVVRKIAPPALPIVELSGADAAARRTEADRLVLAAARRPFDLARGPVLRALLLRLAPEEHLLLVTVHHVAFDGWSIGVFLEELAALYPAFRDRRPSPLPELAVQYADFSQWQRQWLAGEVLEAQLAYWRQQLAGLPALELPLDRPRPALQSFRGSAECLRLPADLRGDLKELGRRQGTTGFMTLLATFLALLGRYTGQADLAVGTAIANRNRAEIEGLLGFFVNTLVLRGDLSPGPDHGEATFEQLLGRVRDLTLDGYAHQDLPFEMLVEELDPERDLRHNPLVQVLFVLQNALGSPANLAPELELRLEPAATGEARFDLTLLMEEDGREIRGEVQYSTDLWDATTIRRLARHFCTLLAGVVADPDRPLSELPLLAAAERHALMSEWNHSPHRDPGAVCCHQRFAARAAEQPDAVAVVSRSHQLSYGELQARADRLAACLRSLGVGPETLVGLFLERSPEALVGIFGVLRAGGAYLPLDPAYPRERLAFMLEDGRTPVILTRDRLAAQLPPHRARVVRLDADAATIAVASAGNVPGAVEASNLAYTIYTSGSTGRPKGVQVTHRGIARMAEALRRRYDVTAGSRVLLWASLSFDAAAAEIFTTLLAGGTLCLAAPEDLVPGPELIRFLRRHEVTNLTLVPSALQALPAAELEALRSLVVAGEAAAAAVVKPWAAGRRLTNAYGPTEATVCATAARIRLGGEDGRPPPIGRPVAMSRVYVLDRRLDPAAIGVAGELVIGGPALARGYLGHPGLTAARFVPDRWTGSGLVGERLYRTGDLVRFLPDGELEFLGRIDQQVKIRGFRIEPGEIEAVLSAHPGVREAVVVAARPNAAEDTGERWLAAYAVRELGAEEPDAGALRAYLGERLPESMVPAAVVFLDTLPRAPSGKVDRSALRRRPLDPAAGLPGSGAVARTPVEEILAGIWAQVLGRERVGVHDNFFALGGHSLLAAQARSRMRQALGIEPPLRVLFERPTVAGLGEYAAAALQRDEGLEAPPIRPAAGHGRARPLSFAQQRLWFLDQLRPGSALYTIPLALHLTGALDRGALARALNAVVGRHEVLRTTYETIPGDAADGGPVQVIRPASELPLPVVDLAGLAPPQRRFEARRLARAHGRRPFDLARGPVLRAVCLRLAAAPEPDEHTLLVAVHHIAFDGWSIGVLLDELAASYQAVLSRRRPGLPELEVQYADFAVWQRHWLRGEVLESQLRYWREQLARLPVLELPCDRPRPAVQSFRGAAEPFTLPAELGRQLAELSRRCGCTRFMTLLAAFQALLGRYTGQTDLAVGSPIANRNRTEIEGLVGFFVNTLVLRADLAGDPSFPQLLARVRDAALEAYAHQDLPFEQLVEALEPERDLSHNPLVQVFFVLQNALAAPRELAPGLGLELEPVGTGEARFDLTLAPEEGAGELAGAVQYSSDLFDAATVRRLIGHFRALLADAAADPERRLSQLSLLTAVERHALLHEWSHAGHDEAAAGCAHALLEARAASSPDAVAVASAAGRLSYAELNARANRLAAHLRSLGVGPEVVVGLLLERSAEALVGIFGVLKAGGAYLPLDPAYPRDRLAFMLEDARVPVVVTRDRPAAQLPAPRARVVCLDAHSPAIAAMRSADAACAAGPSNLAYVIYTSGSTGRPKGVLVAHRGICGMAAALRRRYRVTASSRVLLWASLSFDASAAEIFTTLGAGATLCLGSPEELVPGPALVELLAAQRVTNLTLVPSALQALPAAALPALGSLVVAGEACRGEVVAPWMRGRRLVNAYGPTEATVCTTAARLAGDPGPRPPIGRPVAASRVQVLDRELEPVPAGVPGELAIGGAGLARGYLGRPAATAARFVPDPWGAGDRLYRSGDLVRFLPDGGQLEFLGRIDQQVKVRGFRLEPGEVEAALVRHPGVREAVVVAAGPARIVAYVVRRGEPPAADAVQEFLRRTLPEYMVPSLIVEVEALPLLPNGKVDRGALERAIPEPGRSRPEERVAPRDPVEEVLAGIWAEVLGMDQAHLGVHDNFFALGGHSLLATRAVSRIRIACSVELPLAELFAVPTLAGLGARVREAIRSAPEPPAPAIERVPRTGGLPRDAVPLSFAQERLWFLDRFEPGSSVYNIPAVYELVGRLHPAALAASLEAVVRRHETLRTTLTVGPHQHIAAEAGVKLLLVDLRGLPAAARPAAAAAVTEAEARRPFDLAAGPLLRASLLRLGTEHHRLLLVLHHIVADGWSMDILATELAAFYQALDAGSDPGLAELPIQYADFACWQRRWLRGPVLEEQLAYWRRQLKGAPRVLELPTDRPWPSAQTFSGASLSRTLPARLGDRLEALGQRRGTTLYMTLLAAFFALLYRYTGQRQLVVGAPVANRGRAELEGLIGFFVNTLVLRAELGDDPCFSELLERVRKTALQAYVHQDLPFERLVEELQPRRDLSRSPLFQAVFVLDRARTRELAPGLPMRQLGAGTRTAKFELTLHLLAGEQEWIAAVEYNTDLFDRTTMARLLGHLDTLLEAIAVAPRTRCSELVLLREPERQQLVAEWSRVAAAAPPGACLHELVEARAAAGPEAEALVWGRERLSYAELNARANRLAHHLRRLGVGAEVPVGLAVDRSPELIVAVLAILKAGGAYVPFDICYPRERLAFMLEDTGIRVLVTEASLVERLPVDAAVRLLRLDRDAAAIAAEGTSNPAPGTSPDHLAYVVYTSGSTGIPKGVAVPHRAVVRLVQETSYARFGPQETFLLFAPISFDASTLEIWGPLTHGARLVVVPPGPISFEGLGEAIDRGGVSTLWLTAGLFHQMVEGQTPSLRGVRQLLAGGDVLSPAHCRRVLEELPGIALINGYGPTENTTFTCCYPMRRPEEVGPTVPIGRPIAHTAVYVVDRKLRPVPAGVIGELVTGGAGLARGYYRRPAVTAKRFTPNPLSGEPGRRLYRTGDLVRWRSDGWIEFLGRIDHQVKIRGFRIELGEIEAVLDTHPGVRQAVVLLRPDPSGDKRLVAYAATRGRITIAELRQLLGEKLPDYMVPAVFLLLEELPLLPSGKVDRRALPEPDWRTEEGTSVAPRSPVEEMLAEIWTEVLGPDRSKGRLGVHDDFFEQGGHSLLAAQVISRVRTTFGVELPLRQLFEGPTVAALGESIEAALRTAGAPAAPAVEPVPRHQRLPLSFAQQRLWFLDLVTPGDPTFNMPFAARLSGALDPTALVRGLQEIVDRHQALRTTMAARKGRPYQVIAAALTLEVPRVELGQLHREAREDEVRRLALAEGRRSFDLARGPLLRAVLLRLADGEHLLLLTLHHLVGDGWSFEVLLGELAVLYEAFSAGRASPLPELGVQYADWAAWQRRWLTGEALETQLAYWREQLAGPLPVPALGSGGPRRAGGVARGGQCSITLPASLAAGLRSVCREAGATLFMTLLAAFKALLYRTTGQTDLVVGTPVANRGRGEIEGLIGFFVNTLVLRTRLADPDPTFRELLARVRKVALGAYAHPDVPFEKLVEELQPERAKSHTPFFQVMMTLHRTSNRTRRLGDLVLEPVRIHNRTAQFALTLVIVDTGRKLHAGLEYDRDLFEPAAAERWLERFRDLLEGIVADPGRRLSELPLAAEAGARPATGDEPPAATPPTQARMKQKEATRQAQLTRRRTRLSAAQQALLRLRLEGKRSDPETDQ